MFRILLSNKGSSLLNTLILGVVGAISIGVVMNYTQSMSSTSMRSNKQKFHRIALSTVIDYTLAGIKKRWCFDKSWMQESKCDLFHNRSVERLLLNERSLQAIIQSTMAKPPSDKIRIKEFSIELNVGQISTAHPLSTVAKELKNEIESIYIHISRIDSVIEATVGSEKLIKVYAELRPRPNTNLSSLKLFQEVKVLMTPRELNTNALVIANDLVLNKNGIGSPDKGNSVFPLMNSNSKGNGILIDSPIYVNGNIVLPNSNTTSVSSLTASSDIRVGSGRMIRDGVGLQVSSAGGLNDRFNSQLNKSGGIKGSILYDNDRDRGLDILAGLNYKPIDETLYDYCRRRQNALYDLSYTADSQLYVRTKSESFLNGEFEFSLGQVDQFIPQRIKARSFTESELKKPSILDYGEKKPVALVKMYVYGSDGNDKVLMSSAQMAIGSKINFYPSKSNVPIVVELNPYIYNGRAQPNAIKLNVQMKSPKELGLQKVNLGASELLPNVSFEVEAYDIAYDRGNNYRDYWNWDSDKTTYNKNVGKLKVNGFIYNSTSDLNSFELSYNTSEKNLWHISPLMDSTNAGIPIIDKSQAPKDYDYAYYDKKCRNVDEENAGAPSFTTANWGVDFSGSTKRIWSFYEGFGDDKNPGYFDGVFEIDAGVASFNPSTNKYPTFLIRSLIKRCVIKASATFFTGFLNCEELHIEGRSSPLRIIGTIIAGKMSIHPSAARSGIHWSSIYNPQATLELRQARVLSNSPECDSPSIPLWHPFPSVDNVRTLYACNPLSLRGRAEHFTWTKVDPDCGIVSDSAQVQCKYRIIHFDMKEISRKGVN